MSLSEKLKKLKNDDGAQEQAQHQQTLNKREKIMTALFNRLAKGDDDFAASLIANGSAEVTIANYDLQGGFNLFARMLGNKLSDKVACEAITLDAIRRNKAYIDFSLELKKAGYSITDENIVHQQDAPKIMRVNYELSVAPLVK